MYSCITESNEKQERLFFRLAANRCASDSCVPLYVSIELIIKINISSFFSPLSRLSTVGVQHVFGDSSGLHTSPQRWSSRLVVCTADATAKKNGCWFAWVCSSKSSESPWCYKVIFSSYISSLPDNQESGLFSFCVKSLDIWILLNHLDCTGFIWKLLMMPIHTVYFMQHWSLDHTLLSFIKISLTFVE